MPPKKEAAKASPKNPGAKAGKAGDGKAGSRPKSGKGDGGSKPSTAGAGAATAAAAAQEELQAKLAQLEAEKRQEEQTRNLLQVERDKISGFWEVSRRELEDRRAELRLKDRDLEEQQDKHVVELKVYKQKVKHLLYEHQSQVAQLKADGEAALKQQADAFLRQEAELGDDKRRLKQHVREQELSAVELLKQFRLENAKEISKLRQDFGLQARQIQQKYEAQLKELQDAQEARNTSELRELEEAKNAHIQSLMQSHEKAFRDMRAYYNEITHANLDLIKNLKEEIAEMKRAEAKSEKLMHDVARENKRLTEPLSRAVQEVATLRQAVASAEADRAALGSSKARLAACERQLKAVEWENEVLAQRLEVVQRERDELAARFQGAVLAVQQRSGLKAAVLEAKVAALGSELERQGSQLQAAMHRSSAAGPSRRASTSSRCSFGRAATPSAATAAAAAPSPVPGPAAEAAAAAPEPALECIAPAGNAVAGAAADSGGSSSAAASGLGLNSLLATALNTPLPDPDEDILEDDAPATIMHQLEAMQQAGNGLAGKEALAGNLGQLGGLEGKLAVVAAAAEGAAAEALGSCGMIPAVRSQLQGAE